MNRELAEKVVNLALKVSGALDESVRWIDATCPQDEALRFKRAVEAVVGQLVLGVLNPIFQDHPDLAPADASLPIGAPDRAALGDDES